MKVLIENIGKNALTNFSLGYDYKGNQTTNVYTDTIQPGDTAYFTFDSTISFTHSSNSS